jgi:hypothetical protein
VELFGLAVLIQIVKMPILVSQLVINVKNVAI